MLVPQYVARGGPEARAPRQTERCTRRVGGPRTFPLIIGNNLKDCDNDILYLFAISLYNTP